jgi:dihydroorotase
MRIVVLLALGASLALGQSYDLLLKGGRLIDPKNGIDGPRDIAVTDGRVAAVAANIPAAQSKKTIDVTGLILTPGLIDLHTHNFFTGGNHGGYAGDNSVAPDAFSFRTGVTTMVDAGSSGWRNFESFRANVIDHARTRVLALINIGGYGMIGDGTEQTDFSSKDAAAVAKKHKDVVVGIKSAHYRKPDWGSVDAAIEAGRLANIPIMVDFGNFLPERPYFELVGKRLRPGDISTHCFRAPVPWVDAQGKLYDYLRKARARGIRFDVGHGGGSFVIRNAAGAFANGFYPDTISSDLHIGSMNGAMMDMPTLMSKLMALGMPLTDVIRASTWTAAETIHRPELGHLSVGAVADIAAFQLAQGTFGFYDNDSAKVMGKQRLTCELTLREGLVSWDWNGRAAIDWKTFPRDYGMRPVDSLILPSK